MGRLSATERGFLYTSTLVAASPVFEAAFTSTMREGETAVYEISDSTPEAVEAMLCFVYTGELPEVELLHLVYELAMQYELEIFAKLIAARMVEEVSVSNVKVFVNTLKLYSTKGEHTEKAFKAMVRKIKEASSDELLCASY